MFGALLKKNNNANSRALGFIVSCAEKSYGKNDVYFYLDYKTWRLVHAKIVEFCLEHLLLRVCEL